MLFLNASQHTRRAVHRVFNGLCTGTVNIPSLLADLCASCWKPCGRIVAYAAYFRFLDTFVCSSLVPLPCARRRSSQFLALLFFVHIASGSFSVFCAVLMILAHAPFKVLDKHPMRGLLFGCRAPYKVSCRIINFGRLSKMYVDKNLLAAGIVKDYRFRSQECLDLFLYKLQHDSKEFLLLHNCLCEDGTILVRFLI